jgi:hypothetical protein
LQSSKTGLELNDNGTVLGFKQGLSCRSISRSGKSINNEHGYGYAKLNNNRVKSSDLSIVISYVQFFDRDSDKYKFINHDDSNDIYYVNLRRKTIIKCSKQFIKNKYKESSEFIKTKRLRTLLVVIDKTGWFEPQAFPQLERFFTEICNAGASLGTKFLGIIDIIKGYVTKTKTAFSILHKIDWVKLGDLVISIFLSASTALCGIYGVLQFLYNLLKFSSFIKSLMSDSSESVWDNEQFEPQSFSLEALMAGFSLVGVPSWLLEKIRNFALLTGTKIHASHSFSMMFSKIRDIIISVLEYVFSYPCFSQFAAIASSFIEIIKYLFAPFDHYDHILNVVEQYTQFIKDQSILHNPVFRNDVLTLYDKLNVDTSFQDYVKNNDNKHFISTWTAYRDNLVKFARTYSTSEREEPICIVFDGPPSSGKSVLMNKFVELLKADNMSVITHTVPPIDASKDFYDDYLNQDVFVMDDVGQQGKSQWRTIINFVSPVKYPLDCAQADKKNTKFFQSKIILCTTNNFKHLGGFVSKDGISCPEALFRRVHLVEVKKNVGAGFSQRLTYNKFDERVNQWQQRFVRVNDVATNHHSDEDPAMQFPYVIDTPRKDGLGVALKWLYTLYKHLEESNKMDRDLVNRQIDNNSIISDVLAGQGARLASFRPQFFDELYDSFNQSWNALLRGGDIFLEYTNYLGTYVKTFFSTLITKFFYKIIKPVCAFVIEGIGVVSEELKILASGVFSFITNLLKGDFNEVHEFNASGCYACLTSYSDMGEVDSRGRPVDIPICVFPCGHTMCAQCSVLQSLTTNSPSRTCGMCRNVSHVREEQVAYYVGNDRVAYSVVRNYLKEGSCYVAEKTLSICNTVINAVINTIKSLDDTTIFLILYYFTLIIMLKTFSEPQAGFSGFFDWILGRSGNSITSHQFNESKKRVTELYGDLKFNTTSAEAFKKNHCRIVVNVQTGVHSCVIVSGKRFLTNSHFDPDGVVLDVYQSIEHFNEGHKEMESVKVKVLKNYLLSDICICEFTDIVPFYKTFVRFGGTDINKFSVNAFVSPYGIIPLVPNVNVGKNKERILYKYKVKGETKIIIHESGSGYQYNVQGAGLCGSAIYDNDRVVGVHVTGNGKEGFAQIFPDWLCAELNDVMGGSGMQASFEVRDKVVPQFSGVRLTYNDESKWNNYGSQHIKTSFVPSDMHISVNEHTQKLYSTIHELQTENLIAPAEVEFKQPPVFGDNPKEVKENMLRVGKKSFKHQGNVTEEELKFIRECIGAILPSKIHELSDEETSFGGANVKGFKKDTSNGFACLVGKDKYLDFDNKRLTGEGRKVIDRFKDNAIQEIFCEDDFVCRETFKDELRPLHKIHKPRLFRVMPFPHIWWSKKLLGELIPWFKKHLHRFGVCVGFNPYKDFDEMVNNLRDMEIFGDEDYGEWDGSLLALIMLEIRTALMERFQGSNSKVLNYVIVTMARCWTLIADELYAATHSMPSGSWLTYLMNCLVNKALVALTLYRNNANATVDDFLHKVKAYVGGDDKIFGSKIDSNYNLLTVKKVVESLGMTVTNGDKSPIVDASRKLMDLNFLKRNIVYHPVLKRYVGALSINTLFNTIQWYSVDKVGDSLTYDDLMRDKCNAVLIEAYLHSVGCFELFVSFFRKNGINGLFTEEKVTSILNSDDGYESVMDMLKKNFYN